MANPTYSTDYTARRESVATMLNDIANRETVLVPIIADFSASDVTNIRHEWVNKPLASLKDTLAAAQASTTSTVLTVSATTAAPARYIANVSVLQFGTESMLVTSVVTITATYTGLQVTRGFRSSTPTTYASGTQFFIVGGRSEGFTANRDDAQYGVREFNFTSIIERQLKLSGTSQSMKTVGDENKIARQVAELTAELMKQLQVNAIWGVRNQNGTNAFDHTMGGLRDYAQRAGNQIDNGGNAVSTTLFDNIIETYANRGGDVSKMMALVSYKQQRKINELKAARIISGGMSQSESTLTNKVDRYDFNGAARIGIVATTDVADNEIIIFQEGKVKLKPLNGRAWKVEDLAKTGDTDDKLIVGEYTMEVANARETLFNYTNLSVA